MSICLAPAERAHFLPWSTFALLLRCWLSCECSVDDISPEAMSALCLRQTELLPTAWLLIWCVVQRGWVTHKIAQLIRGKVKPVSSPKACAPNWHSTHLLLEVMVLGSLTLHFWGKNFLDVSIPTLTCQGTFLLLVYSFRFCMETCCTLFPLKCTVNFGLQCDHVSETFNWYPGLGSSGFLKGKIVFSLDLVNAQNKQTQAVIRANWASSTLYAFSLATWTLVFSHHEMKQLDFLLSWIVVWALWTSIYQLSSMWYFVIATENQLRKSG